ncbi:hypothetical protein CANCADRAFT_1985 [Tortispora caseinolytica NRRL Y-17796]|uniref:Nuclear pore complex protein Nup85 n=1 Tax=Tortispora caseinolytica NRRL Y-17796 TaxID=767744 RepID=A0A1E4TEQ9_9ASCO|nr:hypothetical protein CANCADRAFT_1985 [Tortispora caseinolytica NRRL Y-17796]
MTANEVSLTDAPIGQGKLNAWQKRGRTLKFKWHPSRLQGYAWIDSSTGKPVKFQNNESYLYAVDSEKFSDRYRKFVIDVHEIVKETYQVDDYDEIDDELVDTYFDQLLRSCNSTYKDIQHEPTDIDAFTEAVVTVRLLGAKYFSNNFATSLLQWVNRTVPQPTQKDCKEVTTYSPPTRYPKFWPYMYKCVLRGKFHLALASIQVSDLANEDPAAASTLDRIIDLLKTWSAPSDSGMLDYGWRVKVNELAEDVIAIHKDTSMVSVQLRTLIKVLQGDFDTIISLSETWFEALAALFVFHDPTVSRLPEYLSKIEPVLPVKSVQWENAAYDILQGKIARALAQLGTMDSAIAAAAAEFCDRKGLLDAYVSFVPYAQSDIRGSLIMQHAIECLNHPMTYLTGISYLKSVDLLEAKKAASASIIHIPLNSSEDAATLLQVCDDLQLKDEAKYITVTWTDKLYYSDQIGESILFAASVRQLDRVRSLMWRAFEHMLVVGDSVFNNDIILSQIFQSPSASPAQIREAIVPLAVLSKLYEAKHANDHSEILIALRKLITFPYIPSHLVLLLLCELIPYMGEEFADQLELSYVTDILTTLERVKTETSLVDVALQSRKCRETVDETADVSAWHKFVTEDTAEGVVKHLRTQISRQVALCYLEES